MKYKEIAILRPNTTPLYAIDINDFDSMCIRLSQQLTPLQIKETLKKATRGDCEPSTEFDGYKTTEHYTDFITCLNAAD